jgi:riboflavin biosynthesis pyrimidine reductase
MSSLSPFETLFETERGEAVRLPAEIAMIYGKLQLMRPADGPLVIGNFVETLDGIVSLNIPGHSGGAEISGNNTQDRILMGILRALADAVVVGAGTLRAVPTHLWTAEHIFEPMSQVFDELRRNLGRSGLPLNVIVTASGNLDPSLPVFSSGRVPVLIMTNPEGLARLRAASFPDSVLIEAAPKSGPVSARAILDCIAKTRETKTVLVEGGPHLIGDFFAGDLLHDLFLTLAPQIAGSKTGSERPKLVEGKEFAPAHPKWSRLVSVRRADDHLFLRYAFKDA